MDKFQSEKYSSFQEILRNGHVNCHNQRWSRRHKARGQGHKKIQGLGKPLSRPRTASLGTKDTGGKCRPKEKKVFQTIFARSPKKKRKVETNFWRSLKLTVFKKIFQAFFKILTISKIVLSSSQGQGNFRGFEVSRPRTSSRTSPLVIII